MNYELAKQLKDAGFPQHDGEVGANYLFKKSITDEDDRSYFPTLSELIEACGDGFGALAPSGIVWFAYKENLNEYGEAVFHTVHRRLQKKLGDEFFEGKTPEEAVAKLWLKLNEKD